MSQEDRILNWLSQGYTITPLEALERFQCMALSQRITGLKKRGWPITSKLIKTKTGKHVACYSLEPTEQVIA